MPMAARAGTGAPGKTRPSGPWFKKGRIALVGDAGYCPPLFSGQGTSLALVGAYARAKELGKYPSDHAKAYASYNSRMRPHVLKKTKHWLREGGFSRPVSLGPKRTAWRGDEVAEWVGSSETRACPLTSIEPPRNGMGWVAVSFLDG